MTLPTSRDQSVRGTLCSGSRFSKKTGSPDGFADRKNVKKTEGKEIKFEDQIILFRLTRRIKLERKTHAQKELKLKK
jgi:hypothetical protein